MVEKIKNILKNNYVYLIIFGIFYLIAWCTPLTGDDWVNYGNSGGGIIGMIRSTASYYLSWGGRIGSSLVVLFLTRYKCLWNICSALVVVIIVWAVNKIVNSKYKVITAISFTLLILLTNMGLITECFLWLAGNITYTFCFAMILVYMVYILYKEKKDLKYKRYEYIIFSLLNIFMCTFVENIALGIIVANLLVFVYKWIKNKKIDKFYLVMTLMSGLGLVIQMVSPGTNRRISIDDAAFAELNIFEKVISNIPNFVNFTYIKHPIMILVLVFALNSLVIRKEKIKVIKWISIIFISVIPIITMIANLNCILPVEFNILNVVSEKLNFISNSEKIYIILYWIAFTLYTLYAIIRYCDKEIKIETLWIYLTGLVCVVAMMVTTVWHGRATFATIMCIYIISLKILSEVEFNKSFLFIKVFIITVFVVLSVLYLIVYNSVRLNTIDKYKYIKQEAEKGNKEIECYVVPERLLSTQCPYNNLYTYSLSNYLGLDNDITYVKQQSMWKYQLFYEKLY